jgi:hypothetical protein
VDSEDYQVVSRLEKIPVDSNDRKLATRIMVPDITISWKSWQTSREVWICRGTSLAVDSAIIDWTVILLEWSGEDLAFDPLQSKSLLGLGFPYYS